MEILLINLILIPLEALIIFGVIRQKKIARKSYCLIIFIQLFVLHAFVDPNSMVDLPNYVETFNTFADNSLEYSIIVGYVGVKMEVGWIVLCKILSLIYDNYLTLLLVTSCIIVGGYLITIEEYSPLPWLSVFILACTLYDQSLYVLRQYTAMSLCLLSIPFIIKKQLLPFILIYIFAISIHTTAIIFGVVYFFNNLCFDSKFWRYYFLFMLIGCLFSSIIFNWIFTNTWYNSYSEREGSNYTGFYINISTLLLYLYSMKWDISYVKGNEKVFLTMALLAVFISFIGVGFSPTNRLVKYFTMSSIYLIPMSIKKIKNINYQGIITLIILFFYTMLFFSTSNTSYIEKYRLLI